MQRVTLRNICMTQCNKWKQLVPRRVFTYSATAAATLCSTVQMKETFIFRAGCTATRPVWGLKLTVCWKTSGLHQYRSVRFCALIKALVGNVQSCAVGGGGAAGPWHSNNDAKMNTTGVVLTQAVTDRGNLENSGVSVRCERLQSVFKPDLLPPKNR